MPFLGELKLHLLQKIRLNPTPGHLNFIPFSIFHCGLGLNIYESPKIPLNLGNLMLMYISVSPLNISNEQY